MCQNLDRLNCGHLMAQAASLPDQKTGQLSLDLGLAHDAPAMPARDMPEQPIVKTMLFPRHITLPHFGQIQRQLKQAFAPFGIDIEFRFTRQNRLEMKWVFAPELHQHGDHDISQMAGFAQLVRPALSLTDAERQAFESIMIDFEEA